MQEVDIRLPASLEDAIYAEMLRRVSSAVEGCNDRDERIWDLQDQLEAVSAPVSSGFWRNACNLIDPLTREQHIILLSSVMSTWGSQPWWVVQAVQPQDREMALYVEQWVNQKAALYDFRTALYNVAYDALSLPYAVLYVGWKEEQVKSRYNALQAAETGEIVRNEDELDDALSYSDVPMQNVEYSEGIEFRVPDPSDFYLYPPESQSVEKALAVAERMLVTEEELLVGVRDFGYDPDCVRQILAGGTADGAADASSREREADRRDREGIEGDGENGLYEIFQVIGRLPLMLDEEGRVDPRLKNLLHEDWLFILSKDPALVLKAVPAGPIFPKRPYVVFQMLPTPRRLYGECVTTLLQTLQESATNNLRYTVNSQAMGITPMFKASEQWIQRYGSWEMGPGAIIPYTKSPNDIMPMEVNLSGIEAGWQLQSWIGGRADRLMGAQGANSLMSGKVRKQAEVEFTANLVGAKMDLFTGCLQEPLEKVAQLLVAYYARNGMTGQGEPILYNGQQIPVTQQMLEAQYRFVPRAATQDASPQARMAQTSAMVSFVRSSPLHMARIANGDFTTEYALERRMLEAFGERNIEELIGSQQQAQATGEAMLQQRAMQAQQAQQQAMATQAQAAAPSAGKPTLNSNGNGSKPKAASPFGSKR